MSSTALLTPTFREVMEAGWILVNVGGSSSTVGAPSASKATQEIVRSAVGDEALVSVFVFQMRQ